MPKFVAKATEAVEGARNTVALSAAVSVAALVIACVALLIAVLKG